MRWLSASLDCLFLDLPLLDRFAAARRCGFEAVEMQFPYVESAETLRQAAKEADVVVALINAPSGDWAKGDRGLAAVANRSDEFDESIRLAEYYATVLQVPYVHILAGIEDVRNAEATSRYERRLVLAGYRLTRSNILPLIEPINSFDMPGYFLSSFEIASATIARLGEKRVGLQFDLYHCQRMHGEVLQRLESLLPIVRHVQIAGTPHRHEPGEEMPLKEIATLLNTAGYSGRIGCEYRPRGDTKAGLSWTTAMAEAKP
jgi:2-dehydrotetronate isomerase